MYDNITVKAGRKALKIIQDEGLNSERIKILAGASGGPKWLVLSGLDRVIADLFKSRKEKLFVLGSSIGTWRAAAFAQKDPLQGIERFEKAYLSQRYSKHPSIDEISRETVKVFDRYVSDTDIDYIISHPFIRLNILSIRAHGLGTSDTKVLLGLNLATAATANCISRDLLRFFYDRVLFSDQRDTPPFYNIEQFPLIKAPIMRSNFKQAVLASGAIPMAMKGERNIPGAPPGVYRDGGIIDYHLDIPFLKQSDKLVLYPHFYDYIIPGWFDKSLPWRKPHVENMENVVLVSPSRKFVDDLPYSKIPDRKDFHTFLNNDKERLLYWNTVLNKNMRIGDEFYEAVHSGKIKDIVKPLQLQRYKHL